MLPDMAPIVSFNAPPKADKRDRLAFTYTFEDDYGVESFQLEMRLLAEDALLAGERSYAAVPLSSGSVKRAEEAGAALDLTKHKWAGRKVAGRLIAKDGLGQRSQSEEVFFTVRTKSSSNLWPKPLLNSAASSWQVIGIMPLNPKI